MRTWFLVLLVALLPLRGWVGDAMAGQMLAHQLKGAQAVEATVAKAAAVHGSAHDCGGHAQQAAPSGTLHGAGSPLPADCPTCASCQACSAVALVVASAGLSGPAFGAAPPRALEPHFASAEPLRAHKPPIS